MNAPNALIGLAWYREEQYSLLLALSADREEMAKTYDEWHKGISKTMEDLRERGCIVRQVDIDVRELLAWCEKQGKQLDGDARAEFTAEKVRYLS